MTRITMSRMPHHGRSFLMLLSLCTVSATVASRAQQAAPVATPDVRLEAHGGKTDFYLGEPIQLDLVFENHTGLPFQLNGSDYGDLSEKVEITPTTGWLQWQTPSGHDYLSMTNLSGEPIRIPVRLDEGFIFREPGHYQVRVTTSRLRQGPALGVALPAVTTNEVDLELKAMPASVEADMLRSIRADLANADDTRAGYDLRSHATRRLATLQGNEALAEKIKLLEEGDDDFRSVSREAFASTLDLNHQLALLKDAWTNPALTPPYDAPDALNETRSLLAGRNLEGWKMGLPNRSHDAIEQKIDEAHNADMAALLDSMPRRSGEGRAMGAYFLIEFGGLTDTERARAVDYAIEEFPHMDDTEQHMLLETARPPLRDPRMVPMLKSLLAENPGDKDAVASLIAITSTEANPWVVKTICAPQGTVLLDTFKDVHADRLPEVDTCLAAKLRAVPATPREEFEWKQHAEQAARFASPAILPALKEGWKKSTQDSAVLAVLLRDAPSEAIALLNKEHTAAQFDGQLFYESRVVFAQLQQPFPEEVTAWLRERLANGSDKEVAAVAYALSIGGGSSDSTLIEDRLRRLRNEWKGREHEVATANVNQPAGQARQAEMELVSALGSFDSHTKVDAAYRPDLGAGCMSDMCRFYMH
jgi:hypothetical protein